MTNHEAHQRWLAAGAEVERTWAVYQACECAQDPCAHAIAYHAAEDASLAAAHAVMGLDCCATMEGWNRD